MIVDPVAADTKVRILLEAERLFRVYGYSKTTVADIADACAMSPSNVYRFFASKSEINEAICERILAEKERRVRAIAGSQASASDRIAAMIEDAHRYTVETMLDDRKVHEMVVVALAEQWSVIEAHLQRMVEIMEGVIRQGVAAGEFRDGDTLVMARCLLASVAALTHPTMVAQCAAMENRATCAEMAAFIQSALKA